VRSFDHRSVRALKQAESRIDAGVLIAETAPVFPAELARSAGANVYCPDFRFLDRVQVEQAHKAGVRVIPWTVNDPADWSILLEWGVDGITTDFPDRLAAMLRQRGIQF
jgi:glycerophosphoryl diester phosphodiesterase